MSHDRTFGFVMAGALGVLAAIRYVWNGAASWWLAGIGLGFLATALLAPTWLGPVRTWWMKLAATLGRINARILMTLVFAIVVVPMGLLLRLMGRQPIPISAKGGHGSYWRRRHEGDFASERMERQF
ncbi:MAG: SxtJ family membrane protein [Nitrospirota bacterium]